MPYTCIYMYIKYWVSAVWLVKAECKVKHKCSEENAHCTLVSRASAIYEGGASPRQLSNVDGIFIWQFQPELPNFPGIQYLAFSSVIVQCVGYRCIWLDPFWTFLLFAFAGGYSDLVIVWLVVDAYNERYEIGEWENDWRAGKTIIEKGHGSEVGWQK